MRKNKRTNDKMRAGVGIYRGTTKKTKKKQQRIKLKRKKEGYMGILS